MSKPLYVRVEDWRVRAKTVSHAAFRLYLHLRSFCRDDDTVRADPVEIARTYGRHQSTVRRLLDDLGKAGWVSAEKTDGEWTILVDEPPGKRCGKRKPARSESARKKCESARKKCESARHTHKEYHKTTRPQEDSFDLDAQESRVVALLKVARRAWPKERDKAHEFLDGFSAQIAKATPLSKKQLAQLDRLEREAAPSPTRLRPVYSQTPEAKAIREAKRRALREREEGAA